MHFEHVQDALNYGRLLHNSLSDQYERISEDNKTVSTGRLLEYLATTEKRFAKAIDHYQTNASPELLKASINYTTNSDFSKHVEQNNAVSVVSTDEAVSKAVHVFDELFDLYSDMSDHIDSTLVQEMFAHLADTELQEKRELCVNISRVMDD